MDRCRQPFLRGLAVKSLREVAGEFVDFVLSNGRRLHYALCAGGEGEWKGRYVDCVKGRGDN